MAGTLSAQDLYELVDDGVKSVVASTFLQQLQRSPSVWQAFFYPAGATVPDVMPADADFVDDVATALVCSAISRSALYDFGGTVDSNKADAYWQAALAGTDGVAAGRALYDWAFPANCTSPQGNTFADYLNDNPTGWAAQLASYVSTSAFINDENGLLVASQPNWLEKANLVLYKLNRLDPGTVSGVLTAWNSAKPSLNVSVVWPTYNYVPPGSFEGDQFVTQANQAITVSSEQQIQVQQTPVYHGVYEKPVMVTVMAQVVGYAVVTFLQGKPAKLGLTTGAKPDYIVEIYPPDNHGPHPGGGGE